jgi:hypothetical protein
MQTYRIKIVYGDSEREADVERFQTEATSQIEAIRQVLILEERENDPREITSIEFF